jgi:phosphoribosylanthranilate isomerase
MGTRVKIKICGITNADDAGAAIRCGADALGFIFYSGSPRALTIGQAKTIIAALPDHIMTVGVFVNAPRAEISGIIRQTGIHAIQLSGDEPAAACLGYDRPVIKAIRPRTVEETAVLESYRVNAVLVDGFSEGMYGGTGTTVAPGVAIAAARYFPLILAGGITPETIVQAIRDTSPFAVDVNSGVEQEPGKKDHEKLKQLFARVREETETKRK